MTHRDLKDIKNVVRGNALDAVVTDPPLQFAKRGFPGILLCRIPGRLGTRAEQLREGEARAFGLGLLGSVPARRSCALLEYLRPGASIFIDDFTTEEPVKSFLHLMSGRHTPVSHGTRLTFQLRPWKSLLIKELSKRGVKCLWRSVITRSLNAIASCPG